MDPLGQSPLKELKNRWGYMKGQVRHQRSPPKPIRVKFWGWNFK